MLQYINIGGSIRKIFDPHKHFASCYLHPILTLVIFTKLFYISNFNRSFRTVFITRNLALTNNVQMGSMAGITKNCYKGKHAIKCFIIVVHLLRCCCSACFCAVLALFKIFVYTHASQHTIHSYTVPVTHNL